MDVEEEMTQETPPEQPADDLPIVAKLKAFHKRHEKYEPVTAFAVGFIYDSLTLQRIDKLLDNVILLGYAVCAGILITIMGISEQGRIRNKFLADHIDFINSVTHFFLGGLLSSYVVFYFKSASIGRTIIFVCVLAILLLVNEFMGHRIKNLRFLCMLYYFCCFAFLTFFLPTIVFHRIGFGLFLLSGLISLLIIGVIAAVVYFPHYRQSKRELVRLVRPPLIIYLVLTLLYVGNWIPPVPLALKDGAVYREIQRVREDGSYRVRYTPGSWWNFWKKDESRFIYRKGDKVYCFTSIFAPTGLREKVIHHWFYKSADGKWETAQKVMYPISGGRDGGYRGYSYKKKLIPKGCRDVPKEWRVDIATESKRLLGRIQFELIPREGELPELRTEIR